jgi:hypothetical protein
MMPRMETEVSPKLLMYSISCLPAAVARLANRRLLKCILLMDSEFLLLSYSNSDIPITGDAWPDLSFLSQELADLFYSHVSIHVRNGLFKPTSDILDCNAYFVLPFSNTILVILDCKSHQANHS